MARYLGNSSTKEVHDTNNEQTNCQLSEIVHRKTFNPDTKAQANSEGYDNCAWCIGGSKR
ncbi:MAG: hypothetical protein R3B72_49920 [Polyangiaceae bacterium]